MLTLSLTGSMYSLNDSFVFSSVHSFTTSGFHFGVFPMQHTHTHSGSRTLQYSYGKRYIKGEMKRGRPKGGGNERIKKVKEEVRKK